MALALFAIVALAVWLSLPLPVPKITNVTQLTNNRERKFPPLLTDGTRLYFVTPQTGGWSIAEVSATGGEPVTLPSHFEQTALKDISPDGSELLIVHADFAEDGQLYSLPLPSGLPRRLGEIVAHSASWSPDGQRIVYANGNELYVAKRDGSGSHKLVNLPGRATFPRWSPDGRVLRFTLSDSKTGSTALWEIASDGSHLKPLLPGWSDPPAECCGSWTPNGKYFVFTSERVPASVNLYALEENGGFLRKHTREPTQLTTGPTLFFQATPSRDGKRLLAIGGSPLGELLRYDTASAQFRPFLSGKSATHVSFSKDGQWVAYMSFPDAALWRSRVDGSEQLQLTFQPMGALFPQWSPDGKQIAFSGEVPGKPTHIYTISSEGGSAREVTTGGRNEIRPNWSLDGNSLLFGVSGASPPAVYRVDLRTNEVTILKGSEGNQFPSLSPDGNFIAALSETNHVMIVDVKTGKSTELAKMTAYYPAWSRDGKYVCFSAWDRGEPAFYRVQVKSGKVDRMVSLKDAKRPPPNSVSSWTGLAPDDSPLIVRDTSTSEIYALDWQVP